MSKKDFALQIQNGETSLGIELGSTRIKAVLINAEHTVLASGTHDWENQLINGFWTYALPDVWAGIQTAFAMLAAQVQSEYGVLLQRVGSMGVSAMMHGYLVFDAKGNQLVPFRTWRNTTTTQASEALTKAFGFNIPQRWSVAHLYQAILNKEVHVGQIDYVTTLAGYVHWQLTGQKVVGVGEASGMFPIDSNTGGYNNTMLSCFNALVASHTLPWALQAILPQVLTAGQNAGNLTPQGALLLDPCGNLQAGVPICPPEGDAGTGMVATNSVAEKTGNVSAGTSIFAMLVLEKELSAVYTEIDMVTTPAGKPVAMVHCNNCTSDLDAWVRLFAQLLDTMGAVYTKSALYDAVYNAALSAQPDAGGLLSYNYYSGEPITGTQAGRPLFVRTPGSNFTLQNFARNLLYSAMATLKIGMDILTEQEQVSINQLLGHGGLFKAPAVGQALMASALGVPVAVMESAGEGGPWGMAILAAYMQNRQSGQTLEMYLAQNVFCKSEGKQIAPNPKDTKGFAAYMARYQSGLAVEKAAIDNLQV